jgi:drug/metabolite transporter (DMT)-like permease
MGWFYLSFVLFAINSLLWKWAVQSEHPIELINRRSLYTLGIVVAALLISQTSLSYVFHPDFYLILLASFFGTMGLIFMVSFLKAGSFTRLSFYNYLGITINGVYTIALGYEKVTPILIISSFILLLGYSIFVWDESRRIKKEPVLLTQHLLLAGMTICFTISGIINWRALDSFNPLALMLVQELMVLLTTSVLAVFVLKQKIPLTTRFRPRYPLMALIIMLAVFFNMMGLSEFNPLVSAISSVIVPILTLLAAVIFFKEKMNKYQILSLAIIIIGEIFFLMSK